MKKFIKVVLLSLLIGLAVGIASAQTTTVSGTVVDSDSVAWAKGFITFRLTGSEGSTFYCSGTQMTSDQITVSALLDAAGSFSTSLCSNNNITPTNSQWAITINSAATSPPQNIAPVIINGTTQDLSSYINSMITAIRIPASTTRISAYIDGEIVFPIGGSTYYNLSSTFIRLYNGAAWNNLATGTVSVTSVFGRTGAVTATNGDYTAAQVTNALDLSKATNQTMAGKLSITSGGLSSTGDISIFGGFALLSSNIKDTSAGLAATIASGKFSFPNVSTHTGGIIIGTAQKMSTTPEMTQNKGSVLLSGLNNVDGIPFTPLSPVTITRVEWQLSASATGCTTQPIATVMVNSVASAYTVPMTITTFFGHVDNTLNVPAGSEVQMKITTASAGCTPTTSSAQFVIHYIMQ